MVVRGVREYFAAAVALGAALHRTATEFPYTAVQKNVLHPDRVDLTRRIIGQLIS